jgi:4-hydroxy-3-polyprenylbenzoate decarboxylase
MDELGVAGALQNAPVEICRATTVETYAIAESEWVIEGYIMPEPCWETDAAEKAGLDGATFLFPEWHGYQGTAVTGNRLQITAITHRKDRPIFYTPLADSYEAENITHPFAEASLFQLTHGMAPDLVLDVNAPHAFKQAGGLVIQVKKTAPDDDNIVSDIILAALKASRRSLVIAVDEDVDIYSSADILWAIMTRGIAESHISRIAPGGVNEVDKTNIPSRSGGIVAIDATLPFADKKSFKRAHHPVDRIQLNKWFSESELTAARSLQDDYARVLSRLGA